MIYNLPPELFHHPLMQEPIAVVNPRNGQPDEGLDSWSVAAMVCYAAANDDQNQNANSIYQEGVRKTNCLIDSHQLMMRMRRGDLAAIRQAIALVRECLEQKASEAFGVER